MNEAWVAVTVAAIPVFGAGIGWLIKFVLAFREENRNDHSAVMVAINDLKADVREVKGDLRDHVKWHFRKKTK